MQNKQCIKYYITYRYKYNVRRKKVLPSDQSEHQGGVDAALLKAVGFDLPRTNDKKKVCLEITVRSDAAYVGFVHLFLLHVFLLVHTLFPV